MYFDILTKTVDALIVSLIMKKIQYFTQNIYYYTFIQIIV